ncbi:pentatricopeptide repeat-containing protein At2g35030, mitochondrial-like isoform X2 [Solanum verrucosum]|uniref:pentatricopeptide repeat-containing protein At2g35030, mitochondrial-like isoform X2 n=1 Tax=Solanum verrucosum TaxID=315347 RepID=UPI0020D0F06A|nr:pentatricopeptide repeat-containing protein At2g35030, mitochondrial-like isoform X2 [Solanum verrucosum]
MLKLFVAPVKLRHFFKFCKSVFKLQTKLHFINQPIKHYSLLPRVDYTCNQDVFWSNRIISKLSKGGQVNEARKLFDKMSEPDVVSWTAMISGYIRCGKIDKARELFDRTDAKRDVVTWTAMLAAYARTNRILEAEMLFNEMPEKNVVSWNSLIDGYARNGRIDKGLELFWKMRERNVVSWNMVIAGLARNGRINEARVLFDQMPEKNVVSWTTMIAGLSRNGRVDEARTLFDRTPERNVVSWNAMITGYTQNSRLDEAFELFEMMPEKIVSSWNTMIMGFIQNGELGRARILFDKMRQRDVVSWSTMINGYMLEGRSEEALRNFCDMQMDVWVKPNEGTFVSVLGACSDLAGLSEGMQIHQVINKTIYQKNEVVISALINMYSKCGDVATARKIFDDGLRGQRDLISWNVMIAAYTHHGFGRDAINLFKEMLQLGFKPNDVTYVGLLAACSHSGLVEEGLKYFDELCRDDSIKLREDHYTCLVDLCGRAGRLKEALDVIERLPRTESAFIWGALLSGCNLHGDSETGKLAAIKLLGIEAKSPGTYLSLSKLCASKGKWKEAAKLRTQMKDIGLKKQPGCSWIAVENRVHVFLVGDTSHYETEVIHSLLGNLHMKMKRTGCPPVDDSSESSDASNDKEQIIQ